MAAGRAARVSDLSMVVIYKDGWGRVERCDDGKKRNQELCRVLSLPPTNGSGATVSICGLAPRAHFSRSTFLRRIALAHILYPWLEGLVWMCIYLQELTDNRLPGWCLYHQKRKDTRNAKNNCADKYWRKNKWGRAGSIPLPDLVLRLLPACRSILDCKQARFVQGLFTAVGELNVECLLSMQTTGILLLIGFFK